MKNMFLVFSAGFKGNLSLLELFFSFSRGLKPMEGIRFRPPGIRGSGDRGSERADKAGRGGSLELLPVEPQSKPG